MDKNSVTEPQGGEVNKIEQALPEPAGWYLLTGHGNAFETKRPQCAMPEAWKPAYTADQLQAYAAGIRAEVLEEVRAVVPEHQNAEGMPYGDAADIRARNEFRAEFLAAIKKLESPNEVQ